VKVSVKNLGILKKAEFDTGGLTIICGKNNTGKTYATYALYGFINFWNEEFDYNWLDRETVKKLFNTGSVKIEIDGIRRNTHNIVNDACKKYISHLPMVFATHPKYFLNSGFEISLSETETDFTGIERIIHSTTPNGKLAFDLYKKKGENSITIDILSKAEGGGKINSNLLVRLINSSIKRTLFYNVFSTTFIVSIERTGAAIFQRELDFTRNSILDQLSNRNTDINPISTFNTFQYKGYALPVNRDVDFNRNLNEVIKYESVISKENLDILTSFDSMVGGEYKSTKEGLYYIPENASVRLTMAESASSVRSLLNLGFYLKHIASPGDILMIDEPELNLHPSNQRSMARILSKLVNAGIRVFVTTHSDYILKELNTLIMLKNHTSVAKRIMDTYHYQENELLDTSKVRAYIARKDLIMVDGASRKQKHNTFVPATIDENGIEISEFDDTINEMNKIQEEILFGEP
jgi:hypothetical protein